MFQPVHRRYQHALALTSRPEIKARNSSLRKHALDSSGWGQEKRPFSKRLAQTQSPLPSQNKTLTRLRSWLVNTNQCPERGSCWSTDLVSAKSRLKLARKSTGAVATNTRVPEDQFNIGAKIVRAL